VSRNNDVTFWLVLFVAILCGLQDSCHIDALQKRVEQLEHAKP
jgi:hypothetical protein